MLLESPAFPSIVRSDPDQCWQGFIVEAKINVADHSLIVIGTREGRDTQGVHLDISALEIDPKKDAPFRFMIGKAYAPSHTTVRATGGGVYLEHSTLKGHGIGNLVLNESVGWIIRNFEASKNVVPMTIVRDPDQTDRQWLNKFDKLTDFYGRFGFTWPNPPVENGTRSFSSNPLTVSSLKVWPLENLLQIRKVNLPEVLRVYLARIQEDARIDKDRTIADLRQLLREERERVRDRISRRWLVALPLTMAVGFWVGHALQ